MREITHVYRNRDSCCHRHHRYYRLGPAEVTGSATAAWGQVTAIIAVIPPRYKPAEQPTNGADQPRGRSTATRLSAAPASAASMAASAGEVSRQLVNTMPKATSGMD